jgi:hypothetical protein
MGRGSQELPDQPTKVLRRPGTSLQTPSPLLNPPPPPQHLWQHDVERQSAHHKLLDAPAACRPAGAAGGAHAGRERRAVPAGGCKEGQWGPPTRFFVQAWARRPGASALAALSPVRPDSGVATPLQPHPPPTPRASPSAVTRRRSCTTLPRRFGRNTQIPFLCPTVGISSALRRSRAATRRCVRFRVWLWRAGRRGPWRDPWDFACLAPQPSGNQEVRLSR